MIDKTVQPEQAKPDVFTYHSPDQLKSMSLVDVEALWELIPTERQKQYKTIYDQYIRSEGVAGSDDDELFALHQIIDEYYIQEMMVPVLPKGDNWVRIPTQIRQAAIENSPLSKEDEVEASTSTKKTPKTMLLVMALAVVFFGFMLFKGISSRGNKTAAVGTVTVTPTPSATLQQSPTPTPLALDAQDSIIRSGDTSSSANTTFPVNLRILQGAEAQPRIFVVQRKIIQTTEWNYEDNPDTASYIAGLTVRPVIGIPYSEANAALFERIVTGTTFVLQMNTGASVRYEFASHNVVNRSDTSWFRQVGPGLVLALIGERDADSGEATPDRVVVTATYKADQELNRDGGFIGIELPRLDTPTPTLTPTLVERADVQLISAVSSTGKVSVRLRIFNGKFSNLKIDDRSIWIAYGYAERPEGPQMGAEIDPIAILPGQALDLIVTFSWSGEPYATLSVLKDYQFTIAF